MRAPNLENFPLLKKVGVQEKSILLKQGISATIKEWLMRAGNPNIIAIAGFAPLIARIPLIFST
ncbi:MAG: hypothetical protein AB4038_10645 [Prochloraceae cyanobacterium]